ncbi:extracellular solute-binding protein [Hyphomicrobium sp. 2TAF46]|uniref:extracellular solute-binding protein n=1 Tax=Hyphomicrobium sp. 2TAF46 TaxID=3233019 RepID=UPI003F8F297F
MSFGKFILGLVIAVTASLPAAASPQSAIALHGSPLLADGFTAFPYVNPDAPKGGTLTLGVPGSYESVNPLIVQGTPASGIGDFVLEPLMARSRDEPFTLYGLLADTIDVADDRKSVTFTINPAARFSDRQPVTQDDVIKSFELLKAKGRPNHRTYFAKVTKAEKIGERGVRFTFLDATDRELPLILGLMPVFAAGTMTPEQFETGGMKPLLGSGPYTVSNIDAGRSISYRRDPDYWGKDLPVNRGRYNFDEIRFDYFRDASVMFEAFKSGNIDLRLEDDPGRWAGGYDIPAVHDGRLIKAEFEIGLPAGMTALVFNTRRPIFSDPRVRRALMTLFDFEWSNRTLYNGLFKRTESYFERSYLASTGHPADARERSLLASFPEAVRPEILEGTYRFPVSDGSGQNRPNQKAAFALLTEAGLILKDGRLIDPKTGKQLAFEILANSNAQEALLLSYARSLAPLGISARVRVVDSAQYQQRLTSFDYDMIQNTWPSSLSPGNEQLFRWSAKTADSQGSFNFAGVRNPAADAMIESMLAAESEPDFISSVRALDRVLLSGDYVVPLFFAPRQWVAYWARLQHPDKTPLFGYAVDTWWTENK